MDLADLTRYNKAYIEHTNYSDYIMQKHPFGDYAKFKDVEELFKQADNTGSPKYKCDACGNCVCYSEPKENWGPANICPYDVGIPVNWQVIL